MDITTHPFLNIMWSFFVIFLWISWFMLLIGIVADIFRRREISGIAKAMWLLLVIFLPVIGALLYLIVHGNTMGGRDASTDAYYASASGAGAGSASSGGSAAEIAQAASLRDSGAITEAEFQALKTRALA
jgi:hypothetical protein